MTPDDPTTVLPGRPPVVDLATWQAARDELLVREKAHTREGDALAAARRRLPMVEFDGTVEVVRPDGPVPFLDLFQGRDGLVVYKHMWYDSAPHQGQCEGCTTTAWHLKDAVYLNARGVSFAILTARKVWDLAVAIVKRTDQAKGLVLLHRRWVVERSFAWLTKFRRLVRDCETLPATHEARIWTAATWQLSNRLTR